MNPLIIIGLIIIAIALYQSEGNWLNNAQHKNNTKFEYMNRNIIEASKARKAKEEKDKEAKERLERYQQFRKEAGKGPTFEEWKAARLKEQQEQKHPEN